MTREKGTHVDGSALALVPRTYVLLTDDQKKIIDRHCNWLAFKNAYNAMMKLPPIAASGDPIAETVAFHERLRQKYTAEIARLDAENYRLRSERDACLRACVANFDRDATVAQP